MSETSELQRKLIELSKHQNLSSLGLRKTARMVGAKNPQTVKYHLEKLHEEGLIEENPVIAHDVEEGILGGSDLVKVPIMGAVDAGPATQIAENKVEGYLKVSSAILKSKDYNHLYALKATGASMNRANIGGKTIEEGDYVIVDSRDVTPRDGDYVITVVDSLANIKKFVRDHDNNQIVLLSESSEDFMPIFIGPDDETERLINGKVVQVIKNPRFDG